MSSHLKLYAWAATDVGRRRQHNEDFYLVDPNVGLYGVADGIGGYEAGEVASRMVLEGLQQKLALRPDLFSHRQRPDGPLSDAMRREIRDYLDEAVQHLSYQVFTMAQQRGSDTRMGSTLCALISLGELAAIVHVGDSRCYLYRDNELRQLTEDHSLISEQLKMGLITPEEAAKSRYKNVITRAVGMADRLQVDIFFVDMAHCDRFVLCSDGFHSYLQEGELNALLEQHDLSKVPKQCVELANQRGGKDNISVVVVSVEGREAQRTTQIMAGVTVLQHSPLFRNMSYPETLKILSATTQRVFQPGDVLMHEGAPSTHLFLVQDGELAVYRGQELLTLLGSGDYVGEMGLFDGEPASATVVAQQLTNCLILDGQEFHKLLRQSPDIGFKIQQNLILVLIRRLRNTSHALAWTRSEWRRQSPGN